MQFFILDNAKSLSIRIRSQTASQAIRLDFIDNKDKMRAKDFELHDSGMSKGEEGLERVEKDNEGRDQQREVFHRRRGHHQRKYLLEDEFYEEFWIKVHEKQNRGLSWNRAIDEVRVEILIQTYKDSGENDSEDPALLILKQWPASEQYLDSPEKLAELEQMINRLLDILLESELSLGNRYKAFCDKSDRPRKTLLHYAAELGFLGVSKTLVRKCPLLLTMTTEAQVLPVKKRAMLPLEFAIFAEKDEVAEFLIRAMRCERVQSLFIWKPDDMKGPEPSFFSFKTIIENPKMKIQNLQKKIPDNYFVDNLMIGCPSKERINYLRKALNKGIKKTVVAILDQMMNPQWPYLPQRKENYETEEEREAIEGVWNTISDDPLNYHFYYLILDGDEGGRPPKIMSPDGHKLIENKYFNWKEESCLQAIAKSNNKGALQHPVVRMLVKSKWRSYGHLFLSLQAALLCIFLLCMSFSLLHASIRPDPTQYSSALDWLRGLCEVVTLLMAVFYICDEINQIRIEGCSYFTDWMVLFDWLGLLLILCIILLRFMDHKAQWMVVSLAFLFNFMRIFKFSSVSRTTGLYTQTLANVILHDVTRFIAVFIVILFTFCGALTLSLSSPGSRENQELRGFGDVFLSGIQALSDQYPMVEDYSLFNWLSVLLMIVYMGTVTVILLNVLIVQMSATYTEAKEVAGLEYDVDRILQLTRMERYPILNLRLKYYKKGDWISEMNLAKELLEFSEDLNPWESVEEKLNAIREMIRKMVKQMRPQQD